MLALRSLARAVVVAAAALATTASPAAAIVGGTDVPGGKYPSTAKVTIISAFGCTGTLIAPQWVLTAGHCGSLTGATGYGVPIAFPPQAFAVTVGGVKANGSDGEKVAVDRATIPTGYLAVDGYDVTLLHLASAAKTTPTPVAGRGYEPLWKPNVLTDVVGFGTTSSGGSAPPILQEVAIPVVTDAACADRYSGFEPMTQICGGYAEGGKDSCQGDSGGPMYSSTADGRRLLVGATSYGNGCARPNTPGVYARVADAPLRDDFLRVNAPEAIADAPAGAVTTPALVYDPATKTTSSGTPVAPPADRSPTATSPPSESGTGAGGGGAGAGGTGAGTGSTGSGSGSSTTGTDSTTGSSQSAASKADGSGSSSPGAATFPAGTPVRLPTATPSSPNAAVRTPSGFRAALAVDRRTRRSTARNRGVRARVRCSSACTVTLRLRVDGPTARRLRLTSRTVGRVSTRTVKSGRTVRRVRFSKALLRRVGSDRRAVLSVVVTVLARGSREASVLSARARMTGA
ncbi:MAG: serine protease [Solirubrobacterales bacterium]|nr:serine protease [Solirubrobacterales bacterium]